MNRLTISLRLTLLLGFMSVLLLVIGGIGLYGVSKSDQALTIVYKQRTVPLTLLSEIQYLQLRSQLSLSLAQLEATDSAGVDPTLIVSHSTPSSCSFLAKSAFLPDFAPWYPRTTRAKRSKAGPPLTMLDDPEQSARHLTTS